MRVRTPIYDSVVNDLGFEPKQLFRNTAPPTRRFFDRPIAQGGHRMSCYEWEAGTIKLPAAATAVVKAAVRDANNQLHDQLYTLARDFWNKSSTRSKARYETAVRALELDVARFPTKYPTTIQFDLIWLLDEVADKPRALTHDDINRAVPRATNRTTSFQLGEFSITFAGNLVTWSVPENNRACERARQHPVAIVFFNTLARVKWTRGSGGQIVGNNEYSRESEGLGGGGNFLVEEFGPPVAKRRSIYSTGRLR